MKPPTTPREMIAHLQHELSVANNWIEHHQNHVDDLIKENAALRELSARMAAEMREVDNEFASLRDYDAARKEVQP